MRKNSQISFQICFDNHILIVTCVSLYVFPLRLARGMECNSKVTCGGLRCIQLDCSNCRRCLRSCFRSIPPAESPLYQTGAI